MILGLIIAAIVWSALVICAVLYVGGGTRKRTPRRTERFFDEGWWD
jgi:hypothetical protein